MINKKTEEVKWPKRGSVKEPVQSRQSQEERLNFLLQKHQSIKIKLKGRANSIKGGLIEPPDEEKQHLRTQ